MDDPGTPNSFKDAMKEASSRKYPNKRRIGKGRKRSYGPKDFAATHIEKIDLDALMSDGDPRTVGGGKVEGKKVDENPYAKYISMHINDPDNKEEWPFSDPWVKTSSSVATNTQDDADALKLVRRVTPETFENEFGRNIWYIDPMLQSNYLHYFGQFTGKNPRKRAYSKEYDKIIRMRDAQIERYNRLRNGALKRGYIGGNVFETEEKDNEPVPKAGLPVNYVKESFDPDSIESTKHEVESATSGTGGDINQTILDNFLLGQDEVSDLKHVIIALNNLNGNPQVKETLSYILPLLYRHYTPDEKTQYFSPDDRHPAIYFHTGETELNSSFGAGEMSSRFHEAMHAITNAYFQLFNRKVGNTPYKSAYDADEMFIDAMLVMTDNPVFNTYGTDEGKARNLEYITDRIPGKKFKRGSVNILIGEIISNCHILKDLVEGKDYNKIITNESQGKAWMNTETIQHGARYYLVDGQGNTRSRQDAIRLVIDETLSSIMELHVNGDLNKRETRDMVGPMIGPYLNVLSTLAEMIQSPFTSSERPLYRQKFLNRYTTGYSSSALNQELLGRFSGKSKQASAKIRKSAIKKLNQDALKFDGGRHVDWPYMEQYRNNPNMQNRDEEIVFDTVKRLMPNVIDNMIWVNGERKRSYDGFVRGFDDDEFMVSQSDKLSGKRKKDPVEMGGSRYSKYDLRTTFNDDGKEVLLQTWPFEAAEEYDEDISHNAFIELQKLLNEHTNDIPFNNIRRKLTLSGDNNVVQLENAKWIDRLSDDTEEAMDKAGSLVWRTETANDDDNGSYNHWWKTITVPKGNRALNGYVGGIDTRAHELMHAVFETMFSLDPELTKIGRPRGFKVPMYAGTVHYVNALDRMKDYFGYYDPYKSRETLLDIMRSDTLPRGSKKALTEILFAIEAIPRLAHGESMLALAEELEKERVVLGIPRQFMPHGLDYYMDLTGTDDRSIVPNIIFAWVNEVQSSMAQLEANGDLDEIGWLRPLIPAYNRIIKRAKYLIVRPRNEDEHRLYSHIRYNVGENLDADAKYNKREGLLKPIDELRGESFRRSASIRKALIKKWKAPEFDIPKPKAEWTAPSEEDGTKSLSRKNLKPRNVNEYQIVSRLNDYMPEVVQRTIGGKPVDFNTYNNKETTSRFRPWTVDTTENKQGETILRPHLETNLKAESADTDINNYIQNMLSGPHSRELMELLRVNHVNGDVSPYRNVTDFHAIAGYDRLSDASKRVMSKVAQTLRDSGRGENAYSPQLQRLWLEETGRRFNSQVSGDGVDKHELEHAATNIRENLDSKRENVKFDGHDIHEFYRPLVEKIASAQPQYTDESPHKAREVLDDIMKNPDYKGAMAETKKAMVDILWFNQAIPLLLSGVKPDEIEEMFKAGQIFEGITDPTFVAHPVTLGYTIEQQLDTFMTEYISSLMDLEANGYLSWPYVHNMIEPYLDHQRTVDEALPDFIFPSERDDYVDMHNITSTRERNRIENLLSSQGKGFKRSAKFRKSLIRKLSDT